MRPAVSALFAVLCLSGAASAEINPWGLGNDLAKSVCSDDDGSQFHALSPEEAQTYDHQEISGRYDGTSAVFWFQKLGGGNATCLKKWRWNRDGDSAKGCETAMVNRNGNELRRAGWLLQACGS